VGHGGICTIHAENVETVEKRLRTKPMDIPPMLIPMMNAVVLIGRTKIGDTVVRRVLDVSEITGVEAKTDRATFLNIFKWNYVKDSFAFCPGTARESYIFKKISELKFISLDDLAAELDRREYVLNWMARMNIKNYDDVADIVRKYYVNAEEVYNRARMEMG
jgi:flagellar protein FlaI